MDCCGHGDFAPIFVFRRAGFKADDARIDIFTELVGIQMLLMGTLEPLLRGEKIVQDQITILFRQVQSTKAAKADELLEKRAKQRAEEASRAGRWGSRRNEE